jgi:protein-disulfide isomerase
VTLVEYGDYECPYCRQVHHIIAELQERYTPYSQKIHTIQN